MAMKNTTIFQAKSNQSGVQYPNNCIFYNNQKSTIMTFKIETVFYPTGWVAIAVSGLNLLVSERHQDEDDAIADVKNQIDSFIYKTI